MKKDISKKKIATIFIVVTLLLTWLIQFMPIILGMDVDNTSVSSFDYSSIFFTIGGMMPSLLGIIFVFIFYKKENIKDFFKRCFIPNKNSFIGMLIGLLLICFEVFVTQTIANYFMGSKLGFMGLKAIIANPLMIFYYLFWGLISGPISEEFGWRGFLSDMLVNKKNVFKISLLIGFIWGIWHLPLFFYPAQIQYEWLHSNLFLVLCFILCCMSNALVYSAVYVISNRSVFAIFFLHMFENIISTGIMIYPFSDTYKDLINPVTIVIDVLFFIIITRTKLYKNNLKKI